MQPRQRGAVGRLRCGLLAAGMLAACAGHGSPARPRPNVLLISIDTLRADHLGCYGYERATSPNVDALARQGVLCRRAASSSSWTLPAHASLFTGLPTSAHGCEAMSALAADRLTLAEVLREAGYRTAGFWSGPYLHPRFGLDQGFDEYVNCASFDFEGKVIEANEQSHADVTGPKIVAELERWFAAGPEGAAGRAAPFFLFVHMWDVHFDYIPPPPYDRMFGPAYDGPVDGKPPQQTLEGADRERLIALYDGEIAWTDRHVGRILELLREHGAEQDTLVILTADHGEEFWEHGRFGHRKTLFEESIAVPLLLRWPGVIPAGSTIEAPVSLMDVPATVLDAAGLEPLPAVLGSSLLPLLADEDSGRSRLALAELSSKEGVRLALRARDWKVLVDPSRPEPQATVGWWDLERDPGERSNLLEIGRLDAAKRERVEAVRRVLDELARHHRIAGTQAAEPLPEGLEAALHELGYLGDEE